MVKIVHDELTQLMGGETAEINIDSKPAVILMSGLQGSGKTTFSGKLARMLKPKEPEALIGGLRRLPPRRYRTVARTGRADRSAHVFRT